jgi:hypothetical protein
MGQDQDERNFGPQPLDKIMTAHGLDNHGLVAASREPLTHKAVQRARKGRRLTNRMQLRISEALTRALQTPVETPWKLSDLFNYRD